MGNKKSFWTFLMFEYVAFPSKTTYFFLHCPENLKQMIPEIKLRGLVSQCLRVHSCTVSFLRIHKPDLLCNADRDGIETNTHQLLYHKPTTLPELWF